jgi:hypothetical protein
MVNKDNIAQFLKLKSSYCVYEKFVGQFDIFKQGFEYIFSLDLLKKYILPKEVNWLIYGEKAINPALFKNILNFSGVDSNLKKIFLKYIEESDEVILRKILKFSTGKF